MPDNKKFVGDYNRILGTYDAYADRNINIIPIPCTEYYVIKALYSIGVDFKFKYDWIAVVLHYILCNKSIGKPYPPKTIGYKESFRSFEK